MALYAGLRGLTAAPIANALALVVTAVANTTANRRFTFGVRGREAFARDQAAGLAAFGIALVVTTASISILALLAPAAPRVVELGVLVVANGIATVTRFVLLRAWIARDRRPALSAATAKGTRHDHHQPTRRRGGVARDQRLAARARACGGEPTRPPGSARRSSASSSWRPSCTW